MHTNAFFYLVVQVVFFCRFPVESIVMDVTIDNGTVLSQMNANELLDTGSDNEM